MKQQPKRRNRGVILTIKGWDWLAINREPVSLAELASDFVTPSDQSLVPSAIKFLLRRSLIEKNGVVRTLLIQFVL